MHSVFFATTFKINSIIWSHKQIVLLSSFLFVFQVHAQTVPVLDHIAPQVSERKINATSAGVLKKIMASKKGMKLKTRRDCAKNGIMFDGFDVVSYYQSNQPILGDLKITETYQDFLYYFSSETNRKEFLAFPDKYLPKYQGWCAVALSFGTLACPDFTNFKIEKNELIFFETTGFTNSRILWDSDPITYRSKANLQFLNYLKNN